MLRANGKRNREPMARQSVRLPLPKTATGARLIPYRFADPQPAGPPSIVLPNTSLRQREIRGKPD